jgi:hypothetical protein
MARRDRPRIAVGVLYLLATVGFLWPLPLHLGSALTGDPGGDTGVYVWNQWVFFHETVAGGHYPLRTSQILSLTDPVDLTLHNYTGFLNLLALPLIPWLGVVSAFNLVLMLTLTLTALTTYALVRQVTAATRAEAWLAGLAFAWSPVLVARTTGHFSLVAAAPLPAFLLCLIRAERTERLRDAALAGLCVAWAGFCDVYYAVYCLMILVALLASRLVRISFDHEHAPARWRWTFNVLIVCVGALVGSLALGGGGRFDVLGVSISVHGLYTPMLILTGLILVRLAMAMPPHIQLTPPPPGVARLPIVRALAVGGIACLAPLSPVLYALGERAFEGRLVSPETMWRSSPRGVDLLALVTFNPNHAAARWFHDRQAENPSQFVEYTAALSLVVLLTIAVAIWRAGYRPHRRWVGLTMGFATLALGPFVHVAGVNTYIPGPWAFLRYVPLVGEARTPSRFAVVASLGLVVLFAGALVTLRQRYPQRGRMLLICVGLLLLAELFPGPRPLFAAAIPSIYHTIAADPRPVRVLQLPFGVRDGVSSAGNFTARYQYFQTFHGKRLIGGYLSRISRKRLTDVRAQPTLDALITLSEGGTLTPEHAAFVRGRGPRFVTRSNLAYVVIDERTAPPALIAFVMDAWALEAIGRDGPIALYRPTVAERASP